MDATRFVIVGGGRSGSSHLVWTLNRSPDVMCHSEVFHGKQVPLRLAERAAEQAGSGDPAATRAQLTDLRSVDPFSYLERVYVTTKGKPVVGFKMFRAHNPLVLDRILVDAGIRKILLFRANALARYASLQTAHAMGDWHGKDKPRVSFDPEKFVEVTEGYTRFIEETLNALTASNQPYRFVRYDELNNPALLQSLMTFLGARALDFNDGAKRSEVRASPDILSRFSNPEDAEAFLRGRGLMHWAYEGDTVFDLPPTISEGKTSSAKQ